MTNTLKHRVLNIIVAVAMLLSIAPASFAWYNELSANFGQTTVTGSIRASYFHSGNGISPSRVVYPDGDTEHSEAPTYPADGNAAFEIFLPEEYYNLAWLQYLGMFDDQSYYFYLSNDLDMTGYILPPVGTEGHPFISNFDGNGHTVTGLTIGGGIQDETQSGATLGLWDIGVFGYVASGAAISNTYYKDLTISLQGAAKVEMDNHLITVEGMSNAQSMATQSVAAHRVDGENKVYVGVIAGHVVSSASCKDVYVNNTTIKGGAAAISGAGYFGCVENAETGKVLTLGSEVANIRTAGTNAGFGGSLDLKSIYNRLYSIYSNSPATSQYANVETVIIDEVNNTKTTTATTTKNVANYSNASYRYYPSVVAGRPIEYDSAGSYNIFYNNASTTMYQFMCLYGESTNANYRKDVIQYTKTNEFIPAIYIYSGTNYLVAASVSAVGNETSEENASKWVLKDNGYLYTRFETDEQIADYYLNVGADGSLSMSTTGSTKWAVDANDDDIYTVRNGVKYYLNYSDEKWAIAPVKNTFRMSNGDGIFLSATVAGSTSSANANNATAWIVDETNENAVKFKTYVGGKEYRLGVKNGLRLVSVSDSSDAQYVAEANSLWKKDGNGYYIEIDGLNHYLAYTDHTWKLVTYTGTVITDGNGNYLIDSGTGVSNSTSANLATQWQVRDDGSIVTGRNGAAVYLARNGEQLTISNTSFNGWRSLDRGIITGNGMSEYALVYDAGWKLSKDVYCLITDGNGNYLNLNQAGNGIENGTDESLATRWYHNAAENTFSASGLYLSFNDDLNTISVSAQKSLVYADDRGLYLEKKYVLPGTLPPFVSQTITEEYQYSLTTNIESGNQYVLVIYNTNNQDGSYYALSNQQVTINTFTGVVAKKISAPVNNKVDLNTLKAAELAEEKYLYTITKNGDNYTFANSDGANMSIERSNVNFTGNATNLHLTLTNNSNSYYVSSASNNYRLDLYSQPDQTGYNVAAQQCPVSAYATNNTSEWNKVYFYKRELSNTYFTDDSYLRELVAFADTLSKGDNSNASWSRFQTALSEAKSVNAIEKASLTNANSNQNQINTAAKSLYNAISDLALKSDADINRTVIQGYQYTRTTTIESGSQYALVIHNTNNNDNSYYALTNQQITLNGVTGIVAKKISNPANNRIDLSTLKAAELPADNYMYTVTSNGQYYYLTNSDGRRLSIEQNNVNFTGNATNIQLTRNNNSNYFYVNSIADSLYPTRGYRLDMYSNPDQTGYNVAAQQTIVSAWAKDNTSEWNRVYFYKKALGDIYTADDSALKELIDYADTIVKGDCTDATWNQFQTALASAKSISVTKNTTLANANNSQNQINSAAQALNNAMNALKIDTRVVYYGNVWTANNSPSATRYAITNLVTNVKPSNRIWWAPRVEILGGYTEDNMSSKDTTLQVVLKSVQKGIAGGNPTYFPIRVPAVDDSDYDANNLYKASRKNTGYIISGANIESSTQEASQKRAGDIRVSRWQISDISNSYTPGASTFTKIRTYNDSGIVTSDTTAGRTVFSKFTSYSDSSKKLLNVLNDDSKFVYGVHFMDSAVSMSRMIKAQNVTVVDVDGVSHDYKDYDLPEDCIDFNVVERGTISFFAGTYFTNTNSFFSLHQVFRDNATQKITAIKEIEAVYATSRGKLDSYVYKFTDGTYTDPTDNTGSKTVTRLPAGYNSTPVFKTKWITNDSGLSNVYNDKYIYYFEIPCNSGEYAMGSVSGKNGAYLIYLDIAANGGDIMSSLISTTGNDVTDSFSVDYRDKVYAPNVDGVYYVDHSVLIYAANAPEVGADMSKFSVSVEFEVPDNPLVDDGEYSRGIYTLYVTNRTGTDVTLDVLLCDDDDAETNRFNYAYRVIYTNETYTSQTVSTAAQKNYWKASNTYIIPSSGVAQENAFN